MTVYVVQCKSVCPVCGQSLFVGKGFQRPCIWCRDTLIIGVDHDPTAADQKQAEETLRSQKTAEIKFEE